MPFSKAKVLTVGDRLHQFKSPVQSRRLCPIPSPLREDPPPVETPAPSLPAAISPTPSSLGSYPFPSQRNSPSTRRTPYMGSGAGPLWQPLLPPIPGRNVLPAVLPEDDFTPTEFAPDLPRHTRSEMERVDTLPEEMRCLPTAVTSEMVSLFFRLALLMDSQAVRRLMEVPKEKFRAVLHLHTPHHGRIHKSGWMRTVEVLLARGPPFDRNAMGKVFDAFLKGAGTDIDCTTFSDSLAYLLGWKEPFAVLHMCLALFEPGNKAQRYCTRLELETMVRIFEEQVHHVAQGQEQEEGLRCLDGLRRAISKVYFDMKGRADVNEVLGYLKESFPTTHIAFTKSPRKRVSVISPRSNVNE